MIIYTRNEHPDMQANKLNAKYHLHVQHLTNTTTQGNCIKDIKSNKGIRVMYLKKCITLTSKYLATEHGYKLQYTGYKLKYINQSTKSFNKSTKDIHEFKLKCLTKGYVKPY